MRFLPPEEEIELYEEGFTEDLLNRQKVGEALSELVERIEDPLVIALDGRWGTGKTHFLKRWVGAHTLQNGEKATTVYFDAFQHDYLTDPLIGLVAGLSERIPKGKTKAYEKIKRIGFGLFKSATRIGLAVATSGASEALGPLGDAAIEAASSDAQQSLDAFWQKEEGRSVAMAEFRSAISALTRADEDAPEAAIPLVIVIDELDRCRPDYALELLEVIKHFFAVPHVHFVLGANLSALENSVKARYGPEIDAEAYLRKFLSFTFSLPKFIEGPTEMLATQKYAEQLGEKMKLPEKLVPELCTHLKVVSRVHQVSMRDVQRILSSVALFPDEVLQNFMRWSWGQQIVVYTLVFSKVVSPETHQKFLDSSITSEEIIEYFGAVSDLIEEKIGENYNDNYDHPTFLLNHSWSYIIGKNPDSDYFRRRDIFGSFHELNKIPRLLHDRVMNIFSI